MFTGDYTYFPKFLYSIYHHIFEKKTLTKFISKVRIRYSGAIHNSASLKQIHVITNLTPSNQPTKLFFKCEKSEYDLIYT